ncbi:SigE family RNA polymerase sigma factor [Kibdelosporangium lantanae]
MDGDTATVVGSLADLYRTHRLALVRLAVLLLGDQPTAEDVVQEVFIGLHRAGRTDVSLAYLRVSVVNRSRSAIRRTITNRNRPLPPPSPPDATPSERYELAEEHREVLAALDQLPRRQREVLVLRYYSELTYAEVATTLGIHEGTAKSTAAKGLARLRTLMEGSR